MASLIEWTDEFSVGVSEIDDQHKKLIGLINDLINAIERREKRDILENVLDEMVDYIDYHFKSEEKFFEGMPNQKEHKLMHWEFVKKTNQLNRDYAQQKILISQDILEFLISWLSNHILEMDKRDFAIIKAR